MSRFRIDVADLLSHPGARRHVDLTEPVEGLEAIAARVVDPIDLDLDLDHISEGIVVRGAVRATWRGECSRCLRDLAQPLEVHVDELFEAQPVVGETYPLEGHEIDLDQLVRDAVLLERRSRRAASGRASQPRPAMTPTSTTRRRIPAGRSSPNSKSDLPQRRP